ncbi:MAG: cobalamin biosynthesis protein CbiX [Ferrovum sp.]|jgi:sirohydrochlorin cobaltochelatase|uniref:sirohydrochlorin chelatase n=1 Tax=Ferrovum sp. TaxID=2609467 RepID=UPI002637E87E|nr:CbiX/SirB N-terminal domain-containing protein [Ferrovum sp.]MBW8067349.1 cobalamin biosynthesis protein CbiX [Ferrovum sp.]
MPQGILLFAHGARDPLWARPFLDILDKVRSLRPTQHVDLCFLELMPPSLDQAVQEQIRLGVTDLTIVPLFMAQGGHLRQDLPTLIETLHRQHPALKIRVTPALGDSPELLEAIAQWVVARV